MQTEDFPAGGNLHQSGPNSLVDHSAYARFGTESRMSRLYLAFYALGRVVRTIFLLRLIDDEDLQRTISAATTIGEAWNGTEHMNRFSRYELCFDSETTCVWHRDSIIAEHRIWD
jgi:hypothetical protein